MTSPIARRVLVVTFIAAAIAATPLAQSAPAKTGRTERVTVQSKALEGNLIGDAATRDVSVYLPPSYEQSRNRRYPVVYLLHGFTDSDAKWFGLDGKHWINLPDVLNRAAGNSDTKEVIVVMPNAFNTFEGSMYSRSATIGDWETFVAKELVAFIDKRYRTIPRAASRGLAGHSMGGYGTLRLGMKYPEIFSSIYALSPCCLAAGFVSGGGEAIAGGSHQVEGRDREIRLRHKGPARQRRGMVTEPGRAAVLPRSADQGWQGRS